MKAPIDWLKDYVDINVSHKEFADAMTMSGSKVEGIEVQGEDITKVVVGKIIALERHPDADRLQVSKVDVGNEVIQIVTGAQNISIGDYIPVALVGSTLPGDKKISKGKLRGIESYGMMCSIEELGLTKDDYPDAPEDGIYILAKEELGKDIKEVFGLNQKIVEFEITSNRPDCLSILGLAREAAVTLDTEFKKPVINLKEEGDDASQYISVEVKDAQLCPRFAARVVKNVKIGPSPKWMRDRLKAAGIRPINNIVDITNYVMLEYGQPMHAYDIKDIRGNQIVVRRAVDGETIKTLDDQDRKIDSSMLVIADKERVIGIAGVMGGANSEIREDTSTIVFEAANFDGASVRLAAKELGMRTEASGRFEKGLDAENVDAAINRAAQLVEMLEIGTVCKGMVDCYAGKKEPKSIILRVDKINDFLGTKISEEKMISILRALEFEVDEKNMTLRVPTFRADVEREADVAEEIARFYGYNNIEATLLSGKATTLGRKTYKQTIEDLIKDTMIACGLSEAYTYSFTSPKVFDKLDLPMDSELRRAIVISNPLGEDYSIMRTTSIPDMLGVISTNYNRRIEEARLFEMSKVYVSPKLPLSELPTEKSVLTLGMYGELDFYDLKGVAEDLFARLGIKDYEILQEKSNTIFHPGRTAALSVDGERVGVIGEMHPSIAERFECPERTYIGVIEVEKLVEKASMKSQYTALPKFPAVTRDIAMIVKDEVMVKQIEDVIKQRAGKILEDIKLFDVYKGKQVSEGMKSVAYSITFRATDRTLTDEEVNKAMTKILDGLKRNLDAELR